ncbi:MAG: UDP-N-acetylmuramoyl-L-alanine--D-glutamate ligase [Acidimicrobiales bacterium]
MAHGRVLVYGLGVSGQAAARALISQGLEVLAADDDTGDSAQEAADALGVELVRNPDQSRLAQLADAVDEVVVSPGVPAAHRVLHLHDVPVIGEVELAYRLATVPILAVTGTNGKTTVVTLATAMLEASGVAAVAGGNIGVALVDAVRGDANVVVAEVSSFQLALTTTFRPAVGAWLNFSPDHLDWHPDLAHYRAAQARVWANAGRGDIGVVNVEDPVVRAEGEVLVGRGARRVGFGLDGGDFRRADDALVGPDGWHVPIADVRRARPHELVDALCAMAGASPLGANEDGCRRALMDFRGLPHRVQLVGEAKGVRFYDDSKATTPGAVVAAMQGFESAVLVAGGRNKGLDLGDLAVIAPRLRAVVAIGEAADAITKVFEGRAPVYSASSMEEAVGRAVELARAGDAVVLSPACASFDWYGNYAERGDDFARCVRGAAGATFEDER